MHQKNTSPSEALFLGEMATIDRTVSALARRYRLSVEETEELSSQVKLRLIDNDYRLLNQFEGRSKLSTWLYTLVNSVFWEWRNKQHGRWRSSAEARRVGPVAVKLEELVNRDGYRLAEAIRILRINHGVRESEAELENLLASLPTQSRRVFVDATDVEDAPGLNPNAEQNLIDQEHLAVGLELLRALAAALETLPDEDQLILKLGFREDIKWVTVAQSLGYRPKQLYRKLDRLLVKLRKILKKQGIGQEDPRDFRAALKAVSLKEGGVSPTWPSNRNEERDRSDDG